MSKPQKIIKTLGQIGGVIAATIGTTDAVLNLNDRYKEYNKKQSSNNGGGGAPSSDDNKDKDKDKSKDNKKESADKNESK